MNPNNRLKLADVLWLVWLHLGWTFWLVGAVARSELFEPKPPICDRCGSHLQLLAMTDADGRFFFRRPVLTRGPP